MKAATEDIADYLLVAATAWALCPALWCWWLQEPRPFVPPLQAMSAGTATAAAAAAQAAQAVLDTSESYTGEATCFEL